MAKKGKRGDDSEDDAPVAAGKGGGKAPADVPSKKGKKGRDDDDDVAEITAKVKDTRLKDDADGPDGRKGGKSKGKKGKADSDDDVGGKAAKGKKGKHDSDDEDVPARGAKGKKGRHDDGSSDEEARGKGKKGRRGGESDDDAKPSGSKAPKGGKPKGKRGDDDSDDDVKHTTDAADTVTQASKAAAGKKKKGKKGKHDDDDDDDDVPDILASLAPSKKGRLAALSDSDDDAPKKKDKSKHVDAEDDGIAASAGGKKGKKGRKRDDDDLDYLPGLAAASVPTTEEVPEVAAAPAKEEKEAAAPKAVSIAVKEVPTAVPSIAADADAGDDAGELQVDLKKKKKKKPVVLDAETAPAEDGEEPAAAEAKDAVAEDSLDVSLPKKKKKKAVVIEEPEDAVAEDGEESAAAAKGRPAAEDTVFYGEASMGAFSAGIETADVPPEIAKLLEKLSRGESLSNKERRLKKAWDEEQAKATPLAAGYGTEHKGKPGDEYGISAFTVSQSAKLMAADSAAAENAKDIIVENFTITAHKKELFKNADLKIAHGHRYGLVGPNGQGKTTILKHIAARELPIPPRISLLYVEQEVIADDTPAVQAVLKADKRRANLLAEEKQLIDDLERADAAEEKGAVVMSESERGRREDRLAAIYDELAAMRADASESSARKILSGLGFTSEMQEQSTKHFSGGWRMRISLARALFMQPDLLLLDEPTNHLDLNAVIWLEDYLKRWKNTLLVVSHDQDFLSSIVTDIIHLEDRKLYYYKGNYDDFKEMHAQKVLKQQKDYEKQQKMLKSMKDKGATNKDAKDKALSRAKREGAAVAKKDKRAGAGREDDDSDGGRGRDLILKPKEYTVRFTFNNPPPLSPPILSVSDVCFRYGDKYPWLFKNVNCGIDQSSRVAIVGPNGVGKSTFLSLLIGDLAPTTGDVSRNRFLKIGKYSQHFVDVLPMDKTPVEYLQSKFSDIGYQEARSLLGRFGLEGHAHTIPNSELSGGQKARVVFASLCLEAPHIMVLDEPSNNLDAESIDALADAISKFEGGIVLVSHDARLIRDADCLLWVCDKQDVKAFDGDLEDYKNSLLDSIHKEEEALEAIYERRMKEELEARLAATRERHLKLKALREAKKGTAAAASS